MGVRTFSDKAYQSYYKVIGGDTFFGKKQPNTEGFKSIASDPSSSGNTFSVWVRASAAAADELIVPDDIPEVLEPISTSNIAKGSSATQSATYGAMGGAINAVDGDKTNCEWVESMANTVS